MVRTVCVSGSVNGSVDTDSEKKGCKKIQTRPLHGKAVQGAPGSQLGYIVTHAEMVGFGDVVVFETHYKINYLICSHSRF